MPSCADGAVGTIDAGDPGLFGSFRSGSHYVPSMADTTTELGSCVQTVNGFCADLVEDSEASSFALDDLRARIDEHRYSLDDPGRVFMAVTVACGYVTCSTQPGSHADLAFGEWVPG